MSGLLKPALSRMSLLASSWTYSDRAPCANCITFAAAVVALSPIVSLTLCIMYCCTCGSFKKPCWLSLAFALSKARNPAACASASVMLHPVATSVSTSAVCLSVSFFVVMSILCASGYGPRQKDRVIRPIATDARTLCQRTLALRRPLARLRSGMRRAEIGRRCLPAIVPYHRATIPCGAKENKAARFLPHNTYPHGSAGRPIVGLRCLTNQTPCIPRPIPLRDGVKARYFGPACAQVGHLDPRGIVRTRCVVQSARTAAPTLRAQMVKPKARCAFELEGQFAKVLVITNGVVGDTFLLQHINNTQHGECNVSETQDEITDLYIENYDVGSFDDDHNMYQADGETLNVKYNMGDKYLLGGRCDQSSVRTHYRQGMVRHRRGTVRKR